MKYLLAAFVCLFVAGCNVSPFSPNTKQEVQNQGGSIDEIKNNTNGIMSEIGTMKQKLDIHASKIGEIQEGIANLKVKIGGNENNGTQILSGDGALLSIFAIAVIGMLLFYFYKEKKITKILATEIKNRNDVSLHEGVIRAASYTMVEKDVYNLLYK
jgi:predicted PurR-regulated permease PerM